MCTDLVNMPCPCLLGSIKLARTSLGVYKLLDGQHRIECLRRLIEIDPSFDMDLDIDVFECPKDSGDMCIVELFVKANNSINVSSADIPEKKCVDATNLLVQIWPKNVKVDDAKRACRPNVTKKALFVAVKRLYVKYPQLSPQLIARKAVDANLKIMATPLVDLFGASEPTKTQMGIYEKARRDGFFLNIDCAMMNIDAWPSFV